MIFHGSLLIDLANASWTTLKFFRQRIAKKDFLTVRQNNLLAESDRFTFGARIHNRCDLHARAKRGPVVSQSTTPAITGQATKTQARSKSVTSIEPAAAIHRGIQRTRPEAAARPILPPLAVQAYSTVSQLTDTGRCR